MTRPSHRLPRPVFDKILELEEAAAAALDALDADEAISKAAVVRAGQVRDELAELILANAGSCICPTILGDGIVPMAGCPVHDYLFDQHQRDTPSRVSHVD